MLIKLILEYRLISQSAQNRHLHTVATVHNITHIGATFTHYYKSTTLRVKLLFLSRMDVKVAVGSN